PVSTRGVCRGVRSNSRAILFPLFTMQPVSGRGRLTHRYDCINVSTPEGSAMKLAVSLAAVLFASSAFAQTGTEGSILGTVADSSGAMIPDAAVTITNVETGVAKKVVTDSSGYFQVLPLPRGFYSVAVQKTGFSTWVLQSIELTAAENKRVSPV